MRSALLLALAATALTGCDDTLFGAEEVVEGEGYDAVAEVFDAQCVSCHSDATASSFGDLSLEGDFCDLVGVDAANYSDIKLIVAGDSAASLLWHKVEDSGQYGGVMPTAGKMDQANIDIIANWIDNDSTSDCTTR